MRTNTTNPAFDFYLKFWAFVTSTLFRARDERMARELVLLILENPRKISFRPQINQEPNVEDFLKIKEAVFHKLQVYSSVVRRIYLHSFADLSGQFRNKHAIVIVKNWRDFTPSKPALQAHVRKIRRFGNEPFSEMTIVVNKPDELFWLLEKAGVKQLVEPQRR